MSTGGRVLPNDLEAERGVLGAMLLSRDAIATAAELVSADDFYKPAHGHVFAAAVALEARGDPVDEVTVVDELGRMALLDAAGGAGLAGDLVGWKGGVPAIGHVRRYALIVAELSTLRRLVGVAGEIAELGYSLPDDVAGAIDKAETLVFALTDRGGRREVDRIDGGPTAEFLDALEESMASPGLAGLSTGWIDLDRMTLGLHPGQMVTIAGRTSMGKSAWAAELTANVARQGAPVLLVSAEMSRLELMQRIVSSESRVQLQAIRDGSVTPHDLTRIHKAVASFSGLPVYIDPDPNANLMSIRAEARRTAAKEGSLGLVVVDYLQLLTPAAKGENRQVEVAALSRGLKRLALELHVPVVAASQLNREIEHRAEKRPGLADLRESGAIEQDSDVVLLIYRDEVYHPNTSDKGIAEIIVAKQRNGPTGTVHLGFDAERGRFTNLVRAV